MRFFNKEAPRFFTAIKLYGIGEPGNRDVLLSSILKSVESSFKALPVEYDIGGPYGIKKGTTIGLQAFQNKLAKRGHDECYSLSGETDGMFGFLLLLGAKIDELIYSELILWYSPGNFSISFLELVKPILEPLNAICGFEIDIPTDHNILTETKIKKGILGTIAVEVNNKHRTWLPTIHKGAVRGIYRNNIVNEQQLLQFSPNDRGSAQPITNNLYYIPIPKAEQNDRS